jgi:hypothetical protein
MDLPNQHYIQYLPLSESFVNGKVLNCLDFKESSEFYTQRDDEYGLYRIEESFEYLITSKFYSFFITNNVDVPRFFRGIRSIKRPINEVGYLKLNNYLMRDGKKLKTLQLLNKTLFDLTTEFTSLNELVYKTPSNWKDLYITYNFITWTSSEVGDNYNQFFLDKDEIVDMGNINTKAYKNIVTAWRLKTILFKNIHNLLPIFSFYIYKVDKQIFKNTRGKSGKYTFIWKYVTQYKRIFLVMYWLLKELRLMQGRALPDRLAQLLRGFIFNPNNTWIYKIKKFSTNYVYRNCRHTLAEHYRTVTK